MYPFDLKNAGATRAEMLALKNNDAGECVCLLWYDDKWRVACKAAPPLFFLSFGTQLSFFFSFFFFTMLLALSVFLLTRTNVELEKVMIWIVLLNPHGATHTTRFCNNRASLSAWLSFFLQHVGPTPLKKMIMVKKLSRKSLLTLLYVLLRKLGKPKFQTLRESKNTWKFFCYSSRLQQRVLVHFFQVLLTWLNPLKLNTFSALCNESKKSLLKWYPVPARLLSFDMARCSWQVQCACTITRL